MEDGGGRGDDVNGGAFLQEDIQYQGHGILLGSKRKKTDARLSWRVRAASARIGGG
jgi:hypothetical protein